MKLKELPAHQLLITFRFTSECWWARNELAYFDFVCIFIYGGEERREKEGEKWKYGKKLSDGHWNFWRALCVCVCLSLYLLDSSECSKRAAKKRKKSWKNDCLNTDAWKAESGNQPQEGCRLMMIRLISFQQDGFWKVVQMRTFWRQTIDQRSLEFFQFHLVWWDLFQRAGDVYPRDNHTAY